MEENKNETKEQKNTTVEVLEKTEKKEEKKGKVKSEIIERTGIEFDEVPKEDKKSKVRTHYNNISNIVAINRSFFYNFCFNKYEQ